MKKTKHGDYETVVVFQTFTRYRVHVIFTDDIAKSLKLRYGHRPRNEDADAFCRHTIDGHSHMFLPHNIVEGTVAHEALHVIDEIFDYIGVRKRDKEIMAYSLGFLIEEIYKFKKEVMRHVSKAKVTRGSAI